MASLLHCDLSDSVSDSKFSVKTLASIHPLVMVNVRMTMTIVMVIMVMVIRVMVIMAKVIMVMVIIVIMVMSAILIGVRKLCSRAKKVGRGGKRRDKPLSL